MIRLTGIHPLSSLRARVLWSLVPIFCILFIMLGMVDLYRQERAAVGELSARAKAMAENLAYSSRLAVLTEDRWLLEEVLQNVTTAADFAYVWIYGEKWKALTYAPETLTQLGGLKPELDDSHKIRLKQEAGFVFSRFSTEKEGYIEYIVPVTSMQSTVPYELQIEASEPKMKGSQTRERTIGAVRLGLSMNRVEAQVASFLKWRALSLLVFLCLSTAAIYVFSVRITRPINRLTEQAKKMSQGYLNEAIPAESRDEIGQLATAFNDMARALSDQYLGLEQKVAERTKELRTVNLKLAEASEHKSRFLANVNHELRTPLSSIIGYARLLRRETEGQIPSLQRENLEDLLRNAERLLGGIDSLLDLAKIEAGKMEVRVETVAVDELIRGAISTVEPMLDKSAVRLVRDVPATVAPLNTDREKFRQIILNLLGNAVKFTEQGEIRISACQVNGNFKLAVADTGIGIDKVDLAKIFEEFGRGTVSNSGQYHGTGLGLAIVKKLTDLLGGTVAVETELGKGSTFTVTLPMRGRGTDLV
jgi:signal transduction histidine kinase